MVWRLHSKRGLDLAARILTLGWLSAAIVHQACAGQDRAAQSPDLTPAARTYAAPVVRNGSPDPLEITDLLARIELQIADARTWSPPDDNAVDTFRAIVNLLPEASASDLRAIQSLPSRFAALSQTAEAAGRHEEAQRFLIWARAFATLPMELTRRPTQPAPGASEANTAPAHEAPSAAASSPSLPTTTDGALDTGKAGAQGTVPLGSLGTGAPASQRSTPPAAVAGIAPERRSEPAPPPAAASLPPPQDAAGLQPLMRLAEPSPSLSTVALLMRRGAAMQRLGDVSAARLFYERAAMAGSAQAATAMGKTFDPVYLEQMGARGVTPDPDSAATWYRKAVALGDREAESLLRGLGREPSLAAPLSAPPAARAATGPSIPVRHETARSDPDGCQAITLKVQLGEEPSDAERAYLRRGCPR